MATADGPSRDYQQDRGGHLAEKRERTLRSERKRTVEEWTDLGHQAFAEQRWPLVHAILSERLLPHVDTNKRTLRETARAARGEGRPFDQVALRHYLQTRSGAVRVHVTPGVDPGETTLQNLTHDAPALPAPPRVIAAAYRSVYTALALGGYVDTQAVSEVPAWEYQHQVGVRHYSPESRGCREAQLIETGGELKATLLTGGQGSGKSTALETIVEDRVANGHKIIDLIDLLKAENVMYDIPSQSRTLRNVRARMGLDVGFGEYDPPAVEVYAPLTPDLAESRVPFNVEGDEPIVRPFIIPASELTYRQLVMVLPHTTPTQENYLQSAHQMLRNRDIDYTLSDVAIAVREETNASDSVADRIERSLETVQQKAFIQDGDAPEAWIIDWGEMMADVETVTAFTMSTLRETGDKLLIASYLIDQLYAARQQAIREMRLHEYPPATVVMRELHKVVPKSKSEQDAESTMEGHMIDTMEDLIALVRHANCELLCDTQKFATQIDQDVAKLFHRIFAFSGQKPDIKKVFRTRVDDTDPAERVAQFGTGECALVSGDGYTMPIQMAPPRCHHLEAGSDGNGLGFRCRHLDTEELRPAPWDASVPSRLQFGMKSKSPIARFWADAIVDTGNGRDFVLKEDITNAYSKWADVNGEAAKDHDRLHKWISENTDAESGQTKRHDRGDDRRRCYWAIDLQF